MLPNLQQRCIMGQSLNTSNLGVKWSKFKVTVEHYARKSTVLASHIRLECLKYCIFQCIWHDCIVQFISNLAIIFNIDNIVSDVNTFCI